MQEGKCFLHTILVGSIFVQLFPQYYCREQHETIYVAYTEEKDCKILLVLCFVWMMNGLKIQVPEATSQNLGRDDDYRLIARCLSHRPVGYVRMS